jgi:hypothetical protein
MSIPLASDGAYARIDLCGALATNRTSEVARTLIADVAGKDMFRIGHRLDAQVKISKVEFHGRH